MDYDTRDWLIQQVNDAKSFEELKEAIRDLIYRLPIDDDNNDY